ncbi:MAG: MAPEG family protein [Wenzhouxiangella sp.]
MPYTVTMFYAGLLGLILIAMSMRLVMMRRRLKVGLGSGGNEVMQRQVRAHANFCEYVPLALLLLLLMESASTVPVPALHALGIALVAGRILHGFFGLNLSSGTSLGRFWGTFLTWLVIVIGALWLLYLSLGKWLSA